jgi:fructose-specific phosphotransferase system component IIB
MKEEWFTVDESIAENAFMSIKIDFETNNEYDIPDQLRVKFITEAPTTILAADAEVVQWG